MNQPKPKRGQKFTIKETGETVTLNRIQENGDYFCDHENGDYEAYNPSELKPATIGRTPIKSMPKPLSEANKEFKKELNVFFASEMLMMPFLCDNCDQPLMAFTSFEKRCTIAHILEKRNFKEVATHPMNKVFLCAKGGCHSKFDNSTAQERSQMKVYTLALERYGKIKSLLTGPQIVQAEKYLNINSH